MDEKRGEGAARILQANRAQLRLVSMDLEGLLPEDHQARAVWAFVEHLDLSEFEARIKSREGVAGRPAIDPHILLALWILATVDGVGASREIQRLCQYHLAYQWICGGVAVNHHTLSDFRNLSSELLKGLLAQTVAVLLSEGLVELRRVAQDGMKVRASAGASSFRTRARLEAFKKIAAEQVAALTKEMEDDPGAATKREQTARQRAEQKREKKIKRALEEMTEAEERKESNNGKKKTEARTSLSDPEARLMKMPDGGFRPAFNVHLTTTTNGLAVLAAEVNNHGTDLKMMVPLGQQIEELHQVRPEEWLADGGCATLTNIDAMGERGCKVYSPLRPRRNPTRKRSERRSGDSEAVAEWRERMETEEAKSIYRQRGATAEWVNAQFRNQGLTQFLVRGAKKALAVVLIHAITNNMRRGWAPA